MTRRSWSAKQRLALFTKNAGVCHICSGAITVGQAWEVSHEIPLALGGADDDVNCKPAHKLCHRSVTSEKDAPAIAKAKRQEAKHLGAVAPKQPIKSAPLPQGGARKKHPIDLPPRRSLYEDRA